MVKYHDTYILYTQTVLHFLNRLCIKQGAKFSSKNSNLRWCMSGHTPPTGRSGHTERLNGQPSGVAATVSVCMHVCVCVCMCVYVCV